MFNHLLREPLVHFSGLALLIFAVYALSSGQGLSSKERIEVSPARIEQLAGLFTKSWQRPPAPEELKGLVDDYVTGEIYYREAKALGLDTDDTVIRQRLRLKMELLNDAAVDQLAPSDDELAMYLSAHSAVFKIERAASFEQVFLNPEKHGTTLTTDAGALLEALRNGTVQDISVAGDSILLSQRVPLTSRSLIARDFGEAFAAAVVGLPIGTWSGPIESGYGIHLVKVSARKAERAPALAEVRDIVAREWKAGKRKEVAELRLAEFAKHYDIVIESLGGPAAQGAVAKP
jgi:hypothetical protein